MTLGDMAAQPARPVIRPASMAWRRTATPSTRRPHESCLGGAGAGRHRADALGRTQALKLAPFCIAFALAMLLADMLLTLRLRGLLRPAVAVLLLMAVAPAARAQISALDAASNTIWPMS